MKIILLFLFFAFSNSLRLEYGRRSLKYLSIPDKGLAIFAGGLNSKSREAIDSFEIFNSTNFSMKYLKMSTPRNYMTMTYLNNNIIIAGGSLNAEVIPLIEVYNLVNNSWTTMNYLIPRYELVSTVLPEQNLAIFAGGMGLFYSDKVDIYNDTSGSWTKTYLSFPRTSMTATSLTRHGVSFFGGGYGGYCLKNSSCNYSDIVDIYHSSNNSWTKATLSQPRSKIASASLSWFGLVLFAGGECGKDCESNIVDIYDKNINTWRVDRLSESRKNIASASYESMGYAFFAGGENLFGISKLIEIYDASTNYWTRNYMNSPRTEMGISILPRAKFIVFAGGKYNVSKDSDEVEVYWIYDFMKY